jgi:hypothetical protein
MIVTYSDIQSLLSRTGEMDITIRHPMAKQMLEAAQRLFKWYRRRGFISKALSLSPTGSGEISPRGSSLSLGMFMDEGDGLATDAGGEESDFDLGVDPDTETEMPAELDPEDAQDDEESDGDGDGAPAPAPAAHGVVMGYGY